MNLRRPDSVGAVRTIVMAAAAAVTVIEEIDATAVAKAESNALQAVVVVDGAFSCGPRFELLPPRCRQVGPRGCPCQIQHASCETLGDLGPRNAIVFWANISCLCRGEL